jgi:hypothetical protein
MSRVFRYVCRVLFLLLFGVTSPVFGKDLDVLVRVLYPPFFAEMGSSMCMVPSIQLSESDRALFINAHYYAQAIKQKVSAGLSDEEVRFVLKSAADQARSELREVVKVLKSNPPDREYAELLRWCTDNMKTVANNLLRKYGEEPDFVDGLIEGAKRN